MRLPLDLSNGGWHMPKSLNFWHVNRYSEDRTSLEKLTKAYGEVKRDASMT